MNPFMHTKGDKRWNPDDGQYDEAVEAVKKHNKASIGWLQTELKCGVTKARRYLDKMEYRGIVARDHNDRRYVVEEKVDG